MFLSPHIQRTVPLAAGLLCAVLAGVMWMPLGQSPSASDLPPETTATDTGPDPQEVIAAGAQELLARPLFHITRRPPEVATVAEPAPVVVTLSLTGIVENNNVQVALMRLSNQPDLFRVNVGEKVGNWEIEEITSTSVTVITADGQRETITLTQNN
jgi:hypothetical protein